MHPQRDLDALTLQPATPLASDFAASSSCQHPSATPRHHLHRPPPPRHRNISLSLPEESPLFLMHLCSGDGGGLPSASGLLHAIAHAWPRGQHRWTQKPTHSIKAENTWRVLTTDHRCVSMAIAGCLVPNPSTSTACHTGCSFSFTSFLFLFLTPSLYSLSIIAFSSKGAVVSIGSHMKHIPAHFVSHSSPLTPGSPKKR